MSTRHFSAVLLSFAATIVTAAPADAGFCDWLFGRTPTSYSAGYAPPAVVPVGGYQAQMQTYDNPSVYTGQPVANGYAANRTAYQLPPTGTVAPVSSWAPANPAPGYSAPGYSAPGYSAPGYSANFAAPPSLATPPAAPTPWTVTNTTVGPPVSAQPAFGNAAVGNPVFGTPAFGRPNTGGEVPIARALRGANTTSNPFYGTGNIYPNTFGAARQPYAAGFGTSQITPAASLNGPAVDPLFPNSPRPQVSGLARFFGSLLGTNYRSSYYRAPITYYRPISSVDPITGTTVTTQQACSSYVQQLQRTPYNSFQPGGGLLAGGLGNQATTVTPIGPPMPCGSGGCGITANAAPQPYGPNAFAASPSYAPVPNLAPNYGPQFDSRSPFDSRISADSSGPVGQVGGIDSPSDRDVIPIPSTDPGSSFYQQNTRPLTGPPNSSASGSDRDNVPQPRLESARPRNDEDTYRDGLYRRDVTPFGDEDLDPKKPIDQSSYYKSQIDDEPTDLNGPLGRYRYQPQTRVAPEIRQPNEQSYTRLTPVTPPTARIRTELPVSPPTEPRSIEPPAYSTLRPIPDPNPEPSPFRRRDSEANQVTQPNPDSTTRYESRLQAPKLPPATKQPSTDDGWYKRGTTNSASARISVPVREANLSLKQFSREPAPAKSLKPILRDSGGWLPL